MSVADLVPGFAPTRTEERAGDGWRITVVPPDVVGGGGRTVYLSEDQYNRYRLWRDGLALVQVALPDLTSCEREALQTGL